MKRRTSIGLVLTLTSLLTTSILSSACASVDRFNKLSARLTSDAITASEQNQCSVHAAPCLTADQFKQVNVQLHKVSVAGLEFTKLRIAGKDSVADVHTFLSTVATEIGTLSQTFTDGSIAAVLAKLTELQQGAAKLLGSGGQ